MAPVAGEQQFSLSRSAAGVMIYVMTEADRSATTVLMPEKY